MLFKHCIKEVNGLSFVYEHLQLCSSIGKSRLLNQPFLTGENEIENELKKVEHFILFQQNNPTLLHPLVTLLHDVNDIQQTIQNLHSLQVVDDIELFEIKKLAFISQKVADIFQKGEYNDLKINDLSKVFSLLDPENTQIPHFYIYAAYDETLAKIRKQILQTEDANEREQLTWEATRIEDEIREKLSEILHPYWSALQDNLSVLAEIDLLNAKGQLFTEWGWHRPETSTKNTSYHQLVHPEVKNIVNENGGHFQAVDIQLEMAPCLITGANMSGKTVLLKSLSLAQHLFQFGFYVPAEKAQIAIADRIFCLIDDQQNERHGLSSFATELLNMNTIIETVKQGSRTLVLVDELARTTNPEEGKQLVNAFVEMMQRYHTMAVVTTHYGNIPAQCRRLRVKGLSLPTLSAHITPKDLNRYMDYALEETTATDVPTEALRIAEFFHIDQEFLELAKSH